MVQYIIGDLLTGRRIQTLPVLSGTWSDELNGAGSLSATVSMRNPVVKRLGLGESATVAKSFLAAVDGDLVLQAGPIWLHDYDRDNGTLSIRASGMWSYFDHRMVLPVLAGRLPTDPTTDTIFAASSLHDIARSLVLQAQSWTAGNVPVVLPSTVAGDSTRSYRGVDLVSVGDRLRELTEVINGPDIRFTPQWTTDRLGIQWAMEIGTPTQPLLFSAQTHVFNVGNSKPSVSKLRVQANGSKMGSQAFASGGRASTEALIAASTNTTLTNAGYATLDLRDAAHATVSEIATLQGYADELAMRGAQSVRTWFFSHNVLRHPFLSEFAVGDFCTVRVTGDPYIESGPHSLRITSRSGDEKGLIVDMTFDPEVVR